MPEDTAARRLLKRVLVGAVESVARGLAKGLESVADDAVKAVDREKQKIAEWRKRELGEIDTKGE
jgi:hypothetical protein